MSSRLFQRIREELALAYSVYSYQSVYAHSGVFGVYLGTRPALAESTLAAVQEVIATVAAKGLTAGELMLSLESSTARVGRLAGFALRDEAFVSMRRLPQLIDQVTRGDMARVARQVLSPQRQYVFCLGPRNRQPDTGGASPTWS